MILDNKTKYGKERNQKKKIIASSKKNNSKPEDILTKLLEYENEVSEKDKNNKLTLLKYRYEILNIKNKNAIDSVSKTDEEIKKNPSLNKPNTDTDTDNDTDTDEPIIKDNRNKKVNKKQSEFEKNTEN